MKKKFWGLVIALLLPISNPHPAHSQELKEIYVSEAGNVLGAIFYFNPGFPAWAFVKGGGVLVWVNIEIPGAIIEIDTFGKVKLVERKSPGSISYADGRISRIDDLRFEYESGRVVKIGDLRFNYYGWSLGQTGRINQIGDVPIVIEDGFLRQLGNVRFEYENGLIHKIDGLLFTYETGRVRRIGEVQFDYDWGTLKKVTGDIPGVSLKISSIIEFRRSIE